MALLVVGEVALLHERLIAGGALERPLARVNAQVSHQVRLVCERLLAEVADERPQSRLPSAGLTWLRS